MLGVLKQRGIKDFPCLQGVHKSSIENQNDNNHGKMWGPDECVQGLHVSRREAPSLGYWSIP